MVGDLFPIRDKRQLFKRVAYLLVMLLVLSFLAGTLFGDSGILMNMQVKTDYQKLLAEKERLTAENERLSQEIQSLQHGNRKIEELGRREFGFGRPGEIIFYFPEGSQGDVQRYEQSSPSEKP